MTLEIRTAEPVTVVLESIKRDEALICRARGVKAATVKEYATAMTGGAVFPPVVLFKDAKGVHWLADGFHRTAAAELAGFTEVNSDIREGGRREALLHAASANAAHGLRRTNADKRRAVELVLKSFPKWSDRKIGDACGVDHKTVARLRPEPTGEIPQGEREGADGKTRRAPTFDSEREITRLEATLAALVDRWPGDDVDGRERLRLALVGWSERVTQKTADPKPAKSRASVTLAAPSVEVGA